MATCSSLGTVSARQSGASSVASWTCASGSRRRMLAPILAAILVAYLALPVARSYLLVAAHHSDPLPPADLAVSDLDLGAGLSGWSVQAAIGAPAVVLVHGFKTSREEMLPWARFLHDA